MEKKNKQIYPVVVYLEPPAPFKITQDIDTCIELFFKHDPGSVVSVTEANQYHPILMKKIENGYLKPLCIDYEEAGVPRQMYEPTAYMRNGAVYVIRRENIINNEFYGDPIIALGLVIFLGILMLSPIHFPKVPLITFKSSSTNSVLLIILID